MKMRQLLLLVALACATHSCLALDDDPLVASLTPDKLKQIAESKDIWLVNFFEKSSSCKRLAPEISRTARAVQGIAKVGSVDMSLYGEYEKKYGIKTYPTVKVYGVDKKNPIKAKGKKTSKNFIQLILGEVSKRADEQYKEAIKTPGLEESTERYEPYDDDEIREDEELQKQKQEEERKQKKKEEEKKKQSEDNEPDVIELTESNFKRKVLQSDDIWLVEFYAPWCGHCKNLAPAWAAAAADLKGKVKLGAVDATVHQNLAAEFQIRGYPTIKYFPGGKKDANSAEDYNGDRSKDGIVAWAMARVAENVAAPEINELTDTEVLKEACENHPLCVISILPHILDCQSDCRSSYLKMLNAMGEKYKQKMWGWAWAEASAQPELENALEVGGFGYPAMAVLNNKKKKYSILRGSFSKEGINEFLRDLSYGRVSSITGTLRGDLPELEQRAPWDGKDAELPVEDDIDLSDVDLDEPGKDEL